MMFLLTSHGPDTPRDAMAAVAVKVDHDGRIFLPADLYRRLAVQPGDTLLIDVTDDGLLLWTREMAATALQGLVSSSVPAATSLLSELRLMRHSEIAAVGHTPRGHLPRSARARG